MISMFVQFYYTDVVYISNVLGNAVYFVFRSNIKVYHIKSLCIDFAMWYPMQVVETVF